MMASSAYPRTDPGVPGQIPAIALSDTLNGAALDLDAGSWT
jgi:hypothetical protein